jgi:hypothetical protein
MSDPIQIDNLKFKYLGKLITDEEYAEHSMYTLTKYYIRDVFGPGTNMQLHQFLDDIIRDQKESFNE